MNIPEGYRLVPVELLESLLDDPALVVRMSSDKIMAIKGAMLAAAPTPPQPIYDEAAELNRLFGAAREMLRIAGLANQGSNAYNRAIVNLHEAVTACAQSRAKAGGA